MFQDLQLGSVILGLRKKGQREEDAQWGPKVGHSTGRDRIPGTHPVHQN